MSSPASPPVRVAIVNDYEVVVRGVAAMLEEFPDRITVLGPVEELEDDVKRDIVLYDMFAAVSGPVAHPMRLAQAYPTARLVIFTSDVGAAQAEESMRDVAAGFISKAVDAATLVASLEQIHRGEQPVDDPPAADHRAGDSTAADDWPGRTTGLSRRESEILALIAQGLTNQQIADRAFLSINTIKSYIRTAYRKIGASNRATALLWAIEHGFRPDRRASRGA